MNTPKISVIVPVYNVEKYLIRCVDSILGQTYKNLEIILVNDGSTDESGKMCDRYAKENENIKVVHRKNGGLAAARNSGLDIATGDYIAFVDSDDWIDSDMYEWMLSLATENNADIVRCGYYIDKEGEKPIPAYECTGKLLYTDEQRRCEMVRDSYKAASACTKLYKREIIADKRFDETMLANEDWGFNYDLLKNVKNTVYYDLPKYHYFQRSESIMRSKKNIRNRMNIIRVLNYFLESEMANQMVYEYALEGYANHMSGLLYYILISAGSRANEYKEVRKMIVQHRDEILHTIKDEKLKKKIRLICDLPIVYNIYSKTRLRLAR